MAFHECGGPAWLTLSASLVATVAAIIAMAGAWSSQRHALPVAITAIVLVGLVAMSGFVGTRYQRGKVDEFVPLALSTDRDALRAQGYAEAEQCTNIAAGASILPLVLALGALVLATRQSARRT